MSEGLHGDGRAIRGEVAELRRLVKGLANRIDNEVRQAHDATTRTLDALLATYRLLPEDAVLPPLATPFGGWSISADLARLIAELVGRTRPRRVLDVGSGTTTVLLGYLLREHGPGTVVSLDHDPIFYAETLEALTDRGLDTVVDLRYAPLVDFQVEGQTVRWYDPVAIEDVHGLDLVVVDGPPGSTSPMARWPAGPLMLPRCSEGAVFVLDDTVRDDELAVVDAWVEAGSLELLHTEVWHRRAATVLRRPEDNGAEHND